MGWPLKSDALTHLKKKTQNDKNSNKINAAVFCLGLGLLVICQAVGLATFSAAEFQPCHIITVKLACEVPVPEGRGRLCGKVCERILKDALCVAFLPTAGQS